MTVGEFRMPSLGADMEVGTIIEWRVKPGDTVHRGDIVAVVDTEKSDIEVEIFEDGVVEELVVEPGVEVPVGTVLAHLAPIGAPAVVAAPAPPIGQKAPTRRKPAHRKRQTQPPAPARVVRASPLARRRAAEQGVDLGAISGSGPGGAALAADVGRAGPASPRERTRDRHAAARHATGLVMARSKQEIPHFGVST